MITNLISNFVSTPFVGDIKEAPEASLYMFSIRERGPKTQEQGQFCDPKHHSKTRVNDGDVLLTIARDLRNIREGIINRCTRRETLFHVDTLIDNLENYMAEN